MAKAFVLTSQAAHIGCHRDRVKQVIAGSCNHAGGVTSNESGYCRRRGGIRNGKRLVNRKDSRISAGVTRVGRTTSAFHRTVGIRSQQASSR